VQKKWNVILWWVAGIHLAAVATAIILPAVKNLFHPKPKEIVSFVEFVSEVPAAAESVAEPQPVSKPEPVVKQPVVDVPMPTNKPPKVVEKPNPKPKPKPVVKQTTRVTNPSATPTAPVQKKITTSDIRKALGTGGTVDPFGAYYQTIFARFYAVWQVPIGTAYGTSAQASITVLADGTVSNRRLTRPSGNTAFDQSVQSALNAVSRLPAPPTDLPSRTITIEFVPQ